MRQIRLPVIGGALALLALTWIAYAPALRGDFVYDDAYYIRDNPLLKSSDGLRRIWCTTEFPDYFALSTTSFWLEWRLWGNFPVGYHVTNVSLHVINALLLWLLLARLGVPGAYAAALVFALHPINVESVAWISERKNLLSLLFALLTTLAFVRWDETCQRRWYAAALMAFALALLSKTAVVMLPVVLLLILWWKRSKTAGGGSCSVTTEDVDGNPEATTEPWWPSAPPEAGKRGPPTAASSAGSIIFKDLIALFPFFLLSLAMGLVAMWFDAHHSVAGEIVRQDSMPARLALAGWVTWFYIAKALWPTSLAVIYPRWQINAGSAIAWVPLVTFIVACLPFRKNRAALVAVLCYVTLLFPFLGFLDISFMAYSYVADHWAYIALVPVIALLCAGAANVASHAAWVRAALCVVVVVLGIGTWCQTHVWRDEETLWWNTVQKNPLAWMAHNNLGNVMLAKGQTAAAMEQYRETIRLKPDYGNAHYNLGIANYQQGEYAEAVDQFREASRLKPKSAEAHNNLGAALVNVGRTNDAVVEFETAAELAPQWDEPRANLQRLR